MKLLRRLPKILKFIPGKAQDLRAWFLTMQYWLGGSDDNVEQMVRFLVGTYAHDALQGREGRRCADRLPRGGPLPPRPARSIGSRPMWRICRTRKTRWRRSGF
jgi:cobalamin biosynthesis Mg chelatase CobN